MLLRTGNILLYFDATIGRSGTDTIPGASCWRTAYLEPIKRRKGKTRVIMETVQR